MKLSRRDFLKTGAASAVFLGAGTVGLAGCTPAKSSSSGKSTDSTSSSGENLFDGGIETSVSLDKAAYDVDIVVVGGGAGGMAACATAAENGLNVLLVEASEAVGGTTQFAEGIAAVHSKILKETNADVDVQELVTGELKFSNYCTDARLVKEFLNSSNENLEWLMGLGVEFYPQVINTTQHLYVGQGKAMIAKVNDYAVSKGAQILTSTKAKRLFMDNGKVTGLLCEDKSGDVVIKTGAVIFACGGYIQNNDMIDELQRFNHERVKVTANPGHDGAHITMSYSAGAERTGITLMHFIWAALENFDLHSQLSTAACNEGYFWIDNHGKRFCDESLVTNPSCIDNIILNQKKVYAILTDAEAKHLANDGCNLGWGSYIFAGSKMTDLESQLADAKNKNPEGFYYGSTIDELAKALEVDSTVLTKTITDYNTMVAAGVDTDFGKTAPWLREVPASGPFYAFELKCSAFCTMGGIRVNEKNEVLDTDFNGIPGLYCAGVDCSGLQGTTYCMNIGGGAQGYAVYSGRNAVRNAKAYIGK